MILPFLLHAANRNVKSYEESVTKAFYEIKDLILSKYGKQIGYDIQKIDGKRCHSCDGRGRHPRYSNHPPYKVYDYADCYHCIGGWYKLPKWICLARIKYGPFVFHKPLKREEAFKNPFTEENMGWKVSDQPVIKGYIEHKKHWFGLMALLILLLFCNHEVFKYKLRNELHWRKCRVKWRYRALKDWRSYLLFKPKLIIEYCYYEDLRDYGQLPF